MLHERGSDGEAGVEEERERAGGKAALAHSCGDDVADELTGGRMCGMGFDDDGIAGGESRGGVSAGDREGEREVAGAEDGDGTEGAEHRAKVWFGGRASGVGGIDAGVNPGALFDELREEPELAGGAGDLADETRLWRESGFEVSAVDKLRGGRIDSVSDATQQSGAGFAGGSGESWKGGACGIDGVAEIGE
ncbi:MAG: hypothetical protein NVSMB3_07080 [Acidobacteriaceae bacterium]